MKSKDIDAADKILLRLSPPMGHIRFGTLRSLNLTTDEAQLQRIVKSLCNIGAAEKKDGALYRTNETSIIIDEGGANYIYQTEIKMAQIKDMEVDDLQLSIKERNRNKWLSITSLIISVIALLLSSISLFE